MPDEFTTPDLMELVRRSVDAVNRLDLDEFAAPFTSDSVWDLSPMGLGTYEGLSSIRAFVEDWTVSYEEFELALEEVLARYRIEIACLAGFMRVLTAPCVRRWEGKMLNIHPSLLPSFPGLDPHGQALRAGVKISGATVHFVIPETDAGPIVMQGAVAVGDDDTPDTLAARILEIEHRIYPDALRLLAEGKIRLDGDICKTAGSAASRDVLISPR